MRVSLLALLLCTSLFTGCTALKEKTGEYVTEAVRDKIVKDVDELLENRGLSRNEIKEVIDSNNDGKIDRKEIIETAKSATKDAVLLETKKVIDNYIARSEERLVDNGELGSKFNEIILWLLGLVSAYLGKQIYSAKQNGKRDLRIAVLEKMLQRDIDGDGLIGGKVVGDVKMQSVSKSQDNNT